VYPEHGEDVESLIDAADNAMYKAKAQGRNGYFYLNDSSAGRFAGKTVYPSELRMAIQRDELELVYQPQVNLATGEVVGCEALLRWNHHSRGQLLPNEFLSIAEEKGMLSSIGNWVAHQACGQFNLWRAKGISFDFLAINIAAVQLDDALFLDGIREALEVNSLSPSMLSLEIPEHVAIADIAKTRVFIRRAAEMGLTCTIDDFGSTGESFHYMRELPVRMVKLDQKLLLAIKTGKETQILLKAVVALAEVLQLKIVGVGVERSLQEQTLEQLGCHYGQGYFYAKPMTAENFQAFFSANHKFSDGQWKAG
jgi:EAL domain-containing protein (putative c-di-GMP-specific phosphodiesterase class I)